MAGNFQLNCILFGLGWLLLLLSLLGNARSLKIVSFIWEGKNPEKNLRKLSKCFILTLVAKEKNVFFPITTEFVIPEMLSYSQVINTRKCVESNRFVYTAVEIQK